MTDSEQQRPGPEDSWPSAVDHLTRLLTENPVPSEFDIAILRSTKEGDPFLKSDDHLGLHAGDLPWLARDFRRAYRNVRSKLLLSSCQQEGILLRVTSCLLLVCPDHATAWADRKRALLANAAGDKEENPVLVWKKELEFLNLLMTKHTKAPTSWFHRKYVFQEITGRTSSWQELIDLAKKEIKVCVRVAERYPKNYYAWTHRIFVLQSMQTLLALNRTGNSQYDLKEGTELFQELLKEELSTTEPWLRTHLSDHSAAHFGGCVLRMLLKMQTLDANRVSDGLSTASEAVESARRLVKLYPTHEVLWIFRRICSHAFLTSLASYIECDANASGAVAMFWNKEVGCLLPDGRLEVTFEAGNSSEIQQEQMQIQSLQSSYVAWLLEHICNTGKKTQLILLSGVKESEIYESRQTVLSSLQRFENIPHNAYRKSK